ncbi:HD-GYP domain, c-di-GMP phosphodiesterase class II (or its inactivated variant) [Marinitoga hydrogenitolerans DSM 16785]|uniref:HD-GYP domain, c-di-GMP phosphodiesterase class II (Or its inactivated variant) n=1 Tax=Marinitoga hydrogenitolerans (strain DSM 16785 / JCM 12826 / AT1271) TaxID=1122195 RepID=A0A1M4WCW5_MARH1|nr:HD domain-containing phosphohydrolase [Marinitoga hydrogenitolerans]SHE79064.1 HD-GYP domain, c-di-GMP phosphodiesterase class II (or its inactivated variant) [Marinitoga hydrogenitolerans DSM 16785]
MKILSMHKITLMTMIIILLSFSISFIIISSFLKQNEQVDKLYENIKLTVEVINDVVKNDFENEIINYYFSEFKPSFISKIENPPFENSVFIKNIFNLNIYFSGIKNNFLYIKIRYKNDNKYIKFKLDNFFDTHFSKLNLDFNFYITDTNNNFIYGNKPLYDKYKNIIYYNKLYKIKNIYKSSFDFFNLGNKKILKFHAFFKPNIFDFPINYLKSILYSLIASLVIVFVYHFFLFKFIMDKFNLNKKLLKSINLNSVIEKDDDFEIIETAIPEFNELYRLFFEKINLLKIPLKNTLLENRTLKYNLNRTEKENLAIITFLTSFKNYLYGKNNLNTFEITLKRITEELPFDSELLKQNLNNLFNNLSIKILEIDNIKNNYYSQLETLFSIIGTISEIKEYNFIHNTLISEISLFFGKKLNLNEFLLNSIYYGAKIHDIGKIYIPEYIFLKKEKLDEKEWDIIKKHPKYGLTLLKDLKQYPFSTIGKIVVSHHEKWDGSGYPYGLSEEEIPLEGRIVAIADTLVSLISQKVYRNAYSFEEAIEIIKSESNKSFDPELVDILLKNKLEIIDIIQNK